MLTLRHRDISIRLEHHHRDGLAGQHEADDELSDDAGRCMSECVFTWGKMKVGGRRTVSGEEDGRW